MPPRSRDLTALRRFAEAHAAAHARAAAVRPDAACWCRRQRCAPHESTRVACGGAVVLVLRHDPAVGQVWTLSEVCSACAPLMPHTRVLGRAAPLPAAAGVVEAAGVGAGAGAGVPEAGQPADGGPSAGAPPRLVPGGFSAPAAGGGTGPERTGGRRGRVGPRRGRPQSGGGGA